MIILSVMALVFGILLGLTEVAIKVVKLVKLCKRTEMKPRKSRI